MRFCVIRRFTHELAPHGRLFLELMLRINAVFLN